MSWICVRVCVWGGVLSGFRRFPMHAPRPLLLMLGRSRHTQQQTSSAPHPPPTRADALPPLPAATAHDPFTPVYSPVPTYHHHQRDRPARGALSSGETAAGVREERLRWHEAALRRGARIAANANGVLRCAPSCELLRASPLRTRRSQNAPYCKRGQARPSQHTCVYPCRARACARFSSTAELAYPRTPSTD